MKDTTLLLYVMVTNGWIVMTSRYSNYVCVQIRVNIPNFVQITPLCDKDAMHQQAYLLYYQAMQVYIVQWSN